MTECGDLYLKEIDTVGKGIVLLHDPYFIDQNDPDSGGTYQMVQYIVPTLKAKGYSYRYVYALNAGHTDGKVTRQTLPDALEWLWKGYQPK